MTNQQLTPAEIRLAQYGQRTSTWSTATYNDGTEKALHEIALGLKAEVDRLRAVLADAWVPCSPAWIAANPGQCPSTPRVPGPEGVSHLHPAVLGEDVVDEMAASLARDGFGDDEIADMLGPGVTDGEAPEPTLLRWGLDDVMWGDDDSVIVMLSGPGREPYWLELDPERADVLRGNLAGPDGEQGENARLRAYVASLEPAAMHARSALAALCYDLDDPGSDALGALHLIQQATVGVQRPKDDAAAALARRDAEVMRRCAEFVRDTYSGDETADAADTLERDADVVERGCRSEEGTARGLTNCPRCGRLSAKHPIPLGFDADAAASAP